MIYALILFVFVTTSLRSSILKVLIESLVVQSTVTVMRISEGGKLEEANRRKTGTSDRTL